MLNIASVLNFIKKGLAEGLERYVVNDDEHIIDKLSGVELHIYDDWFKITHQGKVIATMRDFDTTIEQPIVWDIKALITSPDVMSDRKENFMVDIKQRRGVLSDIFENPEPVVNEGIVLEDETEEYNG